MDKQMFISEISKPLKMLGYIKSKNYWHKICNGFIFCINVQGSQWDKNDYYVEIGIAFSANNTSGPSLLQWYCRHRCRGVNGEKNILPDEFMLCVHDFFDRIDSIQDIENLLIEKNATKVAAQYWF